MKNGKCFDTVLLLRRVCVGWQAADGVMNKARFGGVHRQKPDGPGEAED